MTENPKPFLPEEPVNPELSEQILALLDGRIALEGYARLQDELRQNEKARRYFLQMVDICSQLRHRGQSIGQLVDSSEKPDDSTVLLSVLEKDLHDSSIREALREKKLTEQATEEKGQARGGLRRADFTPESLRRFLLNLAAIGVFAVALIGLDRLLYDRVGQMGSVESRGKLIEVAQAQWSHTDLPLEAGNLIFNESMSLKRGYARIQMDSGASFIVQAPARFRLEGSNQIYLQEGNITAYTPAQAKGFTVRTTSSSIVDYGTEFGVVARSGGDTETYVFNGEIEMRSGDNVLLHGESRRLKQGWGATALAGGGIEAARAADTPTRFVRKIPAGLSIPGRQIDLADIVGGGNGYGSGNTNWGIDVREGRLFQRVNADWMEDDGSYHRVTQLEFVDGVFVPDCGKGPQQVTSAGHRFDGFGDTNGRNWLGVINGPFIDPQNPSCEKLILDGREYGASGPNPSAILMNANVGVTFNLQAFRRAYPGIRITQFSAITGINGLSERNGEYQTDFFVLVDGQARYRRLGVSGQGQGEAVEINLQQTDRFLTLVCADSDGNNFQDWGVFAEPVLSIKGIIDEQ